MEAAMTHTVPPGNPEAPTTPAATAPGPAVSASGHHTAAAARGLPAALKRRVPKYADLAPLMQFKKPEFSRAARLRRASTIWDLRDVSSIDLSTDILGGPSRLPVGIAPTGFTRMMQSEGEYAGSQAAAAAGIPYTLSTMGTASIEDVAAAAPEGRNWFQLYLWTDRDRSLELIERAARAGNDTLMVTVDTAVAGARLRDVRNGMTIPPALTLKIVLDASYRPAWWFNFLTHEPLTFASLSRYTGTVADLINSMFDPTLT